ncbi:S49 family peptidase [Leptospira sp. GIMC2001]|uniref:S49 family peptidase n=1 Tax=Leptospira sp. GIMC2001 TaxID=1513297 RepID=UPI00234B449F|nr:S49 family peptidase [Leptospira sp. GIMC2001]WCL48124.1 S49 family peptidase [Leptospira sp. GIMC2001]
MRIFFAILFLPIRILIFIIRVAFLSLAKGNHVIIEIPSRFNDSEKSFLLRRLQPEDENPFFIEFIANLQAITQDSRVKYLSIIVPNIQFGFAEIHSIKYEIEKMQEKGIEVIGYGQEGDLKSLYLLAICNKRYTSDTAEFHSQLPSADAMFFGELIQKLKLRVDVFQSGPYKSFGEMFTRKNFSKEARGNLEAVLTDLKKAILGGFKSETNVDEKILQMPILTGSFLREINFFSDFVELVDFKKFFTRIDAKLMNSNELDSIENNQENISKKKIKSKNKQISKISKPLTLSNIENKNRIKNFKIFGNRLTTVAILPLKGEISSGKQEELESKSGTIEAYPILHAIESLKDNPQISAVLLEIDSPGGSAFDSEKIYKALVDLGKTKPVYAHLGNTCASGGYYLACAAKKIYSPSIAILGSIGTIMMRFDLEGFYKKIGISKDRIGFYPNREIFSDTGKLSKTSELFLKKEIARVENLFLKRVNDARKVSDTVLKQMSGGRIFAPSVFLQNQMIDGIQSIQETLDIVKADLNKKTIQIEYMAPKYNLKSAIRESIPFVQMIHKLTKGMQNPIANLFTLQSTSDKNIRILNKNILAESIRDLF